MPGSPDSVPGRGGTRPSLVQGITKAARCWPRRPRPGP